MYIKKDMIIKDLRYNLIAKITDEKTGAAVPIDELNNPDQDLVSFFTSDTIRLATEEEINEAFNQDGTQFENIDK